MNTAARHVAPADLQRASVAQRARIPAPSGMDVDPLVWDRLVTDNADALIIGEGVPVSRVLNSLWPTLRRPVFYGESRRPGLPMGWEGTLFLESADELTAADLARLFEWRTASGSRVRIIAVASRKVLTPREGGPAFARSFSDRLNAVVLVLPQGPPALLLQETAHTQP